MTRMQPAMTHTMIKKIVSPLPAGATVCENVSECRVSVAASFEFAFEFVPALAIIMFETETSVSKEVDDGNVDRGESELATNIGTLSVGDGTVEIGIVGDNVGLSDVEGIGVGCPVSGGGVDVGVAGEGLALHWYP